MGGAVYMAWPPKDPLLSAAQAAAWQFLGVVTNEKPSTTTEATAVSSAQEFSQKVIESLFNYASSFALSADQARLRTSETFVPFSCIQQWYTNFGRRLHQNPNFWKS